LHSGSTEVVEVAVVTSTTAAMVAAAALEALGVVVTIALAA
jgi:hypothetical protein